MGTSEWPFQASPTPFSLLCFPPSVNHFTPFCLKQPGAQRGVNGGQKEGPLHISQGPERQAWMLQVLQKSLLANVGRRESSQSHQCHGDGAGRKRRYQNNDEVPQLCRRISNISPLTRQTLSKKQASQALQLTWPCPVTQRGSSHHLRSPHELNLPAVCRRAELTA